MARAITGSVPRRRGARARLAAALSALVLVAGCASSGGRPQKMAAFVPPPVPIAEPLAPATENQLNLVVWAGYAEQEWVQPFEANGCHVNVTVAGSSDQMVALMKSGQYDVVSASGDASLRMIASGDVAPLDLRQIKNYDAIYADLKGKSWNSVNGVVYGVPHGRGANVLMYNSQKVSPAPTSWAAVFDPDPKYKGKITAYDSPIYIADAALYLMKARPDLGIKNPYALDTVQLNAVVDVLKRQRTSLSGYWNDSSKEQADFESGANVLGTSWDVVQKGAAKDGHKEIQTLVPPDEGATGWSDSWMISAEAKHPTCAYAWIDYVLSPRINAEIAQFFGEAPANAQACHLAAAGFCDAYHANDQNFWKKIWFWTTPTAHCLDGSDRICTSYTDWVVAWSGIRQ
jgi:putative spermidine/putrescine transport system substrate-binding protein